MVCLVKGREYLGEMETNWYPEGRVPFEVTDAFVGARTYSTMTNQLVHINIGDLEAEMMGLPPQGEIIRRNGLKYIDSCMAYPGGKRKKYRLGTKLVAGVRREVYDTETESEDEVIDLNEEVDEDIVITREVTRKAGKG
jgi:hypothetical protein